MSRSPADIARLTTGGIHALKPVLNLIPKIPIATAQINQTAYTYPLAQLTVDDTAGWDAILPGQMFTIGTAPGEADITYGVVRLPPTSETFFMDAKSLGDPGYARDIIQPINNDQYLTVYKYRPPWGLYSSIRGGIFYKQWAKVFTDQGVKPDPVVKMGRWRQAFVGGGGTATLNFSSNGSFGWYKPRTLDSVASVEWDADGGTIIGSSTDITAIIEFEPGFYEVRCKITDRNGKTRTGYRYVWINTNSHDPEDPFAPFNYRYPVSITNDTEDRVGRNIELTFYGSPGAEFLFPGQGFMLEENPTYGGETLDDPDAVVHFWEGYATDRTINTSRTERSVSLKLSSPLAAAKTVGIATNKISEAAAPANWTEVSSLLSNPVGAAWYLSAYHAPYLVDGHDLVFTEDIRRLRRKTFVFQSTTLADQILALNDLIVGNVGCLSDGTVKMTQDPNYFTSGNRNLLDVEWDWGAGDIVGLLNITYTYPIRVGQVYASAYGYGGGDVPSGWAALAPGGSEAQGGATVNMTAFTTTMIGGQQSVQDVAGHHFAKVNSTLQEGYSFTADRNLDVISCADLSKWHRLQLPTKYDPLDRGWVNARALPVSVTRVWSPNGSAKKTIQVVMSAETLGQPGIAIPINRGAANTWLTNQWNPAMFEPYQPATPDLSGNAETSVGFAYALNDAGILGYSLNFLQKEVIWRRFTDLDTSVSYTILDIDIDYKFAPDYRVFVLAQVGNDLHLYRIGAPGNPRNWSISAPLVVTPPGTLTGKGRILCDKFAPYPYMMVWRQTDGLWYQRFDVTAIGSPTQIGAAVADPARDHEYIGAASRNGATAVVAPSGFTHDDGSYEYLLWVSPTPSDPFVNVDDVPADEIIQPGFAALLDETHAFVSTRSETIVPPAFDLSPITFDPGGATNFVINGAGQTAVGNPGDAAWQGVNGGSPGLSVDVELPAPTVLHKISYEVKFDTTFGYATTEESFRIILFGEGGKRLATIDPVDRGPTTPTWGTLCTVEGKDLATSEPVYMVRVGASNQVTGAPGINYVFIDNISVEGQYVIPTEQSRLRKVSFGGTPVWADVTPASQRIALTPYALANAAQASASAAIGMIGTGLEGYSYILASASGGSAWSGLRRTKAVGLKRSPTVHLVFGYNTIDLSINGGQTFYSRLGNWQAAVGSVGKIEAFVGVLA